MVAGPYEPVDMAHGIPVFKPTWDVFRDFEIYVQGIEHHGADSGIVKVIPPSEWSALTLHYDALLGSGERPSHAADGSSSNPIAAALFRQVVIKKPIKQLFTGSKGLYHQMNIEIRKKYSILEYKKFAETQNSSHHHLKEAAPSASSKAAHLSCTSTSDNGEVPKSSNHPFDMASNVQYFEDLEKLYWKVLPFKEAYYGADLSGTLFPSSLNEWNMSTLPGVLSKLRSKIPGVNTPYLYFGSWKSTFAWHVEVCID